MSTSVETSLASLKATTAQIVGIIAGARLMPAGTGQAHLALTAQVTNLVAEIVREHEKGPYMPGIIASCSKELMRVISLSCLTLPLAQSLWTFPPHPSSPAMSLVLPPTTSELRDKGKGKAVVADPEPEVEGSRKRKSPMMSGHSSSPPKSAKKGRKRVKATRHVKQNVLVESEDDEDTIVQCRRSTFPAFHNWCREPHSPRSPHSPKKQLFGPASLIAGSPPKVMATSGSRPEVLETPRQCPALRLRNLQSWIQVIFSFPAQTTPAIIAPRRSGPAPLGWTGGPVPHVCPSMGSRQNVFEGSLPPGRLAPGHLPELPPMRRLPRSQSRGPSGTPAVPAVTTPKAQSRGRSKTITAPKTPAPASASIPSSSAAVPRPALDVPMPDLHSMAIAIRDGAARIALLEARVAEQDGMEPPSPKVQPASIIEGLIFELSQIQPEGPQTSGELVDPDDPGNLVPEYDSDDMDVEVKVEPSADEGEMAT
ncbi:hypothetical protein BDR07DRAFT_1380624 [Suillus spraguei]|nr:hypothetical protein BDR07DRAFT_1380624 [Suillus spraguei]